MGYGLIIVIVFVGLLLVRYLVKFRPKSAELSKGVTLHTASQIDSNKTKSAVTFKQQLMTVTVFTRISAKRFLRDRTAQVFAILFPLIFLLVFGSLSQGNNNISFKVAVVNESSSSFSSSFVRKIDSSKIFKVNSKAKSIPSAEKLLDNSQIDGIIVLPSQFGELKSDEHYPTGKAQVIYSQNDVSTATSLTSVLSTMITSINSKFVTTKQPFSVVSKQLNHKSLTAFDYTFSGLLGFSIVGLGIFGPINVFPELKKQGILRRLHTTPLRVWQYFLSTMFSQAITGIIAIAIQFIVAIELFHLKVDGNYIEIFIFAILGIFMILGMGLAIGGWAKNERQAAPLGNILAFPMLFLSGTFFPRYIMPDWLQTITNFFPLTPVIDGLRQLTTEGQNLTNVGPELGLIAAWFIVIYFIAFRVFKWE